MSIWDNSLQITTACSVVGAWLGAFPIPLDWDRPWQVSVCAERIALRIRTMAYGSMRHSQQLPASEGQTQCDRGWHKEVVGLPVLV